MAPLWVINLHNMSYREWRGEQGSELKAPLLFNGTWKRGSGHIVTAQQLGGFQWLLGLKISGHGLFRSLPSGLNSRRGHLPIHFVTKLVQRNVGVRCLYCIPGPVTTFSVQLRRGQWFRKKWQHFVSCTLCLRAFPSQGYLAATEMQPHASKIWCLVAAASTASALAQDCETFLSSQFCAIQHWKGLDQIRDLPVASSD